MDVVALGLAKAAIKAESKTNKRRLLAGALLSRFQELDSSAAPAANVATITSSTAFTITSGYYVALVGQGLITEVGSRGTFVDAQVRFQVTGTGAIPGQDMFLNGDTIEIGLVSQSAITSVPVWVFVDGQPMTAAPVPYTVTGGSLFTIKFVFPSVARRRIEIFALGIHSWHPVRTTYANLISPAPRRPVVAFLGDSFYAGSTASTAFESTPFFASRLLGVECANVSYGGTGYVNAGSFDTYGSSTRVALTAAFKPDLIIAQGSVNDDASSGRQAAATAAYAAYLAALPDTLIDVWGPQPNNATSTLSASRATSIADIKAAALAAPNVIGFRDMIGTAAGIPQAWLSTGQTYNLGDLCTYQGSVYKWISPVAGNLSSPGTATKWQLVTYALTGTGRIGNVTGNGTRDTYLYSDDVHPMPPANIAFGLRQVDGVRLDLAKIAAT